MSAAEVEITVRRLYNESVAAMRLRHETACQKQYADEAALRTHVKAMPPEAVSESVERLYVSGVKHKLQEHQKLAAKFLFKPTVKTLPESRKELDERMVERFFSSEKLRQEDRRRKLCEIYVAPTEPKMAVRTMEQIQDILSRLTKV
jgi:hypothetical protein